MSISQRKPHILIVDDTRTNVDVLVESLKGEYRLSVALEGRLALKAMEAQLPDLILLDIMMPGMDGYEVCKAAKSNPRTRDIPVIFLSALDEVESRTQAFQSGGVDYLIKPLDMPNVRQRIRTILQAQTRSGRVVSRSPVHAESTNPSETIFRLAMAAELRNSEYLSHVLRVGWGAAQLASRLGIEDEPCSQILRAATLHDIGYLGIPDPILQKPGALTEEEMAVVRSHPKIGARILERSNSPFRKLAALIALTHHERWDGKGYPEGLVGEAIPIEGRITAVIDGLDSMISVRPHRPAMPLDQAIEALRSEIGTKYDPRIAQTLLDHLDDYRELLRRFPEGASDKLWSQFDSILAHPTFERGQAPAGISEVLSPSDATSSQPRILIVDDSSDAIDILVDGLRGEYRISVARDGQSALKIANAIPLDLILLDVIMPDLSGFEVCRQLKADPELREIPVLFLTSLDEIGDKIEGFKLGGADYITKPYQMAEVRARIHAHVQIKRLTETLEERNRSLQESLDQQRELEKLRDGLVHMIVHDLRTPMTGVTGFLNLLKRTKADPLGLDGIELVDRAMNSSKTLIDLINDLLDVSRMESNQMPIQPEAVEIGNAMRTAVESLGALAKRNPISLETNPKDLSLTCDPELLRRVIQNLLGNAIKFSRPEVPVALRAEKNGTVARFTIADRGPGIPVEYREKIFEKFGQVQCREENRKFSTGLGLTFCKLAVEAHGGEIGVESEVGVGSTFWFTIPLVGSPSTKTPSH